MGGPDFYSASLSAPSLWTTVLSSRNEPYFTSLSGGFVPLFGAMVWPMAATAAEAREMLEAARHAGVVNAVTFNYRYFPIVQHARVLIRRGDAGQVRFVHGHYMQEWLLYETDFSWRLERDKAGPACVAGDAGAHWFDLAQHLTGLRVESVLADLTTAIQTRKRPVAGWREAFAENSGGATEDYTVTVDDLSSVLLRFDNGAVGNFFGCQLCAGHKNDLRIEINGSRCSLVWEQERPNELWIGRRGANNETLLKDPALLDPSVRHYAALPGGHNEAWPDAFRNLMRNVLTFIAEGRDPASADGELFPTFETGYRVAAIVDAVVRSQEQGSRWVEVDYR